jgi:hypothetical protein
LKLLLLSALAASLAFGAQESDTGAQRAPTCEERIQTLSDQVARLRADIGDIKVTLDTSGITAGVATSENAESLTELAQQNAARSAEVRHAQNLNAGEAQAAAAAARAQSNTLITSTICGFAVTLFGLIVKGVTDYNARKQAAAATAAHRLVELEKLAALAPTKVLA